MALETLQVELTVVLGKTRLPLRRVLRMRRSTVVPLDPSAGDLVDVLANGLLIARGRVKVEGEVLGVEIVEMVRSPEVVRTPGMTIGGGRKATVAAAG